MRRGDLPAQSVARHLKDGVGVILVDVTHGQAPLQHLVKAYGSGEVSTYILGRVESGSGLAPVQHLEHLVLDGSEQGHVDVENVL